MARPRGGACAPLLALLLAVVTAGEARAQASVLSGRVTNEQGAPIAGANIVLGLGNLGTTTNETGTYTLTVPADAARGQRTTLSARFIGFSPVTREITLTPGPQTQNFSLKADPFRLDEVVVTGVSEATSARKLAFSVARVSEEQLREVPASSPVAALAGKVSGARIAVGTGNPGATPTIRLRGSTNLSVGGSQPLIIVDGVITAQSIADIDANDIESIEVLKGAAAASFYGSNAANGVVNITTKRGRNVADGSTSVTVRSEYGTQALERWVPLTRSHIYQLDASGQIFIDENGQRVVDEDGIMDNPYPTTGANRWRNQLQEWIQDGETWTTTAQLGVRRGNTNLHTTFTSGRNQGVLPMTRGQDRTNFRLNVDQGINSKIDLSAGVTYGINKRDNTSSSEGWFALLQSPPDLDLRFPNGPGADSVEFFPKLPDWAGSSRGNPLYGFSVDNYSNRRERILGSASLRYRPTDWLRLEGSFGTDRLNVQTNDYNFRGILNGDGIPGDGSMSVASAADVATNAQVNATATRQLGELFSTTRVAWIQEQERNRSFGANGSQFQVTGVPDLDALNPNTYGHNSSAVDIRAINYAVSQNLDFRDRYILDLMYRRDGSSLFGSNDRWQNFYRVAGAWRISEDFAIPGVQELKLRAARGTAGLRPSYSSQYEVYSLSDGNISKSQLGNKDLRPAVQTEDEYGVNVQFLDRFDLEVVRAERETEGAFLSVPLSLAQSGGFQAQIQNAATVGAKTTEVALNVRVFDRPDWSYSFSLTGDNTTQRIISMDRAPFRVNADGSQGQNVFFYKSGEVLGIIYGTRWMRSMNELADNPNGLDPNAHEVNSLGYVVNKESQLPVAYVAPDGTKEFKIGDVNPDFSFGFQNNFRFRNFGIYALFDGVQGGDVYNFTKQWMFQDHRHADMDQSKRAVEDRVPNAFFASGLYNALNASDYFVEDGSYVRLREFSVNYTFSPNVLERIGLNRVARGAKLALIGRNLFTWTNYSGFDPEVTSGNDFNFRIDGFKYPNFRQITGSIELTF